MKFEYNHVATTMCEVIIKEKEKLRQDNSIRSPSVSMSHISGIEERDLSQMLAHS